MINRECGVFKTTYQADMALYTVPLARITVWAFLAFFVFVLPFVVDTQRLVWANLVGIHLIAALGLNILVGLCGQISVGHAAFMAVGGYTAAIMSSRADIPFWIGLVAGGVFASVYGLLVGLPSVRIKGFYLAFATLAAQFITEWTITHVKWIGGGFQSSIIVPRPSLGPLTIDTDVAAELIGVDIARYKLLAFMISSFYAGVAGALWVYYLGNANIEAFRIVESIAFLAMIIIGGLGSVLGTIYGTAFVVLLPFILEEILQTFKGVIPVSDIHSFVAHLRFAVYGGLIVLFLMVEPEGLNRLWRNVKDYFRVWPFPY
jgi:branched-chain amino acid transport system permease protein